MTERPDGVRHRSPAPGRVAGLSVTVLLALLVTTLLVIAAVALGGRDDVALSDRPVDFTDRSQLWAQWALVLAMSVAWVAVATLVIARSRPDGDHRRALRTALKIHFVLSAVVVTGLASGLGELPSLPGGSPGTPDLSGLEWRWGAGNVRWLMVLALISMGVLLVGSFFFLLAVLWANHDRFFRERGQLIQRRRYGRGPVRSAEPEEVAEALREARRALHGTDDARGAVIAAYAAMESSLITRGTPRRPTDTPSEVVRAAVATGVLVSTDAAQTLLTVFHTARFSSAALETDAIAAADDALATLQRDLAAGVLT